ncbi:hypothetical protein CAPTEDRAFT_201285 [Capitella teleta]|uniref:Uncharacterized protein n=1 Tax=Capitella teleta TaxID=283909 RepID=R7T736_CAPTE|nr:hypothetical protein CAPTEDRAFT_201285 [Capitella teleta]|eukprot:ELT89213.1 hypothetical protein CAPTEDRAFT_201285 [Capitella teleta]
MKLKGPKGKGNKSGKATSASARNKKLDKKRRERSAQSEEDLAKAAEEAQKANDELKAKAEEEKKKNKKKEEKRFYPIAPDGYIPNSVIRQFMKPKEEPKPVEEEPIWKLPVLTFSLICLLGWIRLAGKFRTCSLARVPMVLKTIYER